ncbi:Tau-tubulin kinase Asator, partial [Araneus ventricosus]
CPQKRAS